MLKTPRHFSESQVSPHPESGAGPWFQKLHEYDGPHRTNNAGNANRIDDAEYPQMRGHPPTKYRKRITGIGA
jgi:hypothetical protein